MSYHCYLTVGFCILDNLLWGSTVGYPSGSLASCIRRIKHSVVSLRCNVSLTDDYCVPCCHVTAGRGGTVAAAPPPFRSGNPAVCGSHPLVTPYYCRLGDLLCFVFIVSLLYFFLLIVCVPSVLWYYWLGLLTCKNPAQSINQTAGRPRDFICSGCTTLSVCRLILFQCYKRVWKPSPR